MSHHWDTAAATFSCKLLKCLFEIVTKGWEGGGEAIIMKTCYALLVPFDFNLFNLAVLFKSLMPVIISPLIWVLLCYKSNKVDVHVAFPLPAVPPLSIIWLKWQNLIVSFLPALRHQGQKVLVEDMDTYTLNTISREESGEYKCSLADNEKMEASQNIAVSCEYLWHMQQPARKSLLRHGKFTFLFPSRILKTAAIHEEAPLFTPKMSR